LKLFKKKSDDSRARRNTRLRLLQLRKFGFFAGFVAAMGGAVFTGYHTGSFKKVSEWAATQTLTASVNAGFKVKDILVTGRHHIAAEDLLSHLSIKENMPIFGVSITDARSSLSGMPWVEDVSIARRLPDTIIVALKERTPAALWQYKQKISLIDRNGVVLASGNLDAWKELPLIVGENAPQSTAQLIDLLNAEPVIAARMISAVRVGGRRWDLRLKNDIAVKLPEQDMELALRRLVTLDEQKKLLSRNIASIDLRQPAKLILTLAAAPDAGGTEKINVIL
jgi:cell division protein FtsQ